jgi:Clp amino terminal domain, pathogenicity island component
MIPLPNLQQLIETVRDEAASPDPLDQLQQASRSAAELQMVGDELVDHFVGQCRQSGSSWSELSGVLGVSKQAAHKRFSTTPTLERFTERARTVLHNAVEEARQTGGRSIHAEHILLALFEPADSLAAKSLAAAGIERDACVQALRATASPGPDPAVDRPRFSAEAKQAIRAAVDEALMLGHNYIGTEHLLLAILTNPASRAAKVLGSFGASYESVKADLARRFEEAASDSDSAEPGKQR